MISRKLKKTFSALAAAGTLASTAPSSHADSSFAPVKAEPGFAQNPQCPTPPQAGKAPGQSNKADTSQTQDSLQKLGFDLGASGVDGVAAQATQAAIKEAQWFYGLPMTGSINPEIRFMLNQRLLEAQALALQYDTTVPIAAAVARASELTCTSVEELAARGLMQSRISMSDGRWLALLKFYGKTLHLDGMAEFIEVSPAIVIDKTVRLSTPFETVENFLISLKDNPRINRVLQAADKSGIATAYAYQPAFTGNSFGVTDPFSFDEKVFELQQNLSTLGFSPGTHGADGIFGEQTRRSAVEAFWFFDIDVNKGGDAITILKNRAALALEDSKRFKVSPGVAAGMRRASENSDIPMSYFFEMGKTEGDFDPNAKNPISSATGWSQFTDTTWLVMIKMHGDKAGLSGFARMIDIVSTKGVETPVIHHPFPGLEELILSFRKNPRVSAIMVAELTKINSANIKSALQIEPTNIELYLAHFLGSDGAILFLRRKEISPDMPGKSLFPLAAKYNRNVFFGEDESPRSLLEIQAELKRRLYTPRFHQRPADANKYLTRR